MPTMKVELALVGDGEALRNLLFEVLDAHDFGACNCHIINTDERDQPNFSTVLLKNIETVICTR
jgi:hypothetical protein